MVCNSTKVEALGPCLHSAWLDRHGRNYKEGS